jgi:predicted RND superfamily exporter protein
MPGTSRHARTEQAFARWGGWMVEKRRIVVLLSLLATALLASGLPKLRGEFSDDSYLRSGDDALEIYDAFRERYGQDERIVVGVTAPDLFDLAFLERLRSLHSAIEQEVPFVEEVQSLVNARSTRGVGDELVVEELMEAWAGDVASLARFRERALANPLYTDVYLSRDQRFTALNLKLDTYSSIGTEGENDFDFEVDPAAADEIEYLTDLEVGETLDALGAIVDRFGAPDFEIHVVGGEVLGNHLEGIATRNSVLFISLAIGMVCVMLVALFRRISAALLAVVIVQLSILSTFGLMGHLGLPFTIMTQMVPIFLIAVGVCDVVHILAIVYRRLSWGRPPDEAISYAFGHSGLAVVLTSLTTAGGLVSFVAAEITPIAELGVVAPLGVLITLLYCLTLLPALTAMLPLRSVPQGAEAIEATRLERALAWTAALASRYPRHILAGTVLLLLVAATGLVNLRFQNHMLQWLHEGDPIRVGMERLDDALSGISTLEILIDTGRENGLHEPETLQRVESAMRYAESFQEGPVAIGKAISIVDVVKEIHQALHENRAEAYALPDQRALIAQELLLFENSGSDDLEEVTDSRFQEVRITLRAPMVDGLHYVEFLDVFEPGLSEILGPDLAHRITGSLALSSRAFSLLLTSLVRSYVLALVIITPLMVLLIGNLRLGLLAMIPNLIPVYLILAMMGWFGITLNMSTLLIGSVVIGLAVDDTIHFVHKFNVYLQETGDPVRAVHETFITTGVALLSTSLILSMSFSTFLFSDFVGTVEFGILAGSGALIAFLADILVGPALMVLAVGRGAKPE